jgi:hypothetical protein
VTVFGVDYAWGRPGPAALKKAGAKFACRYLSHDTSGKNLTRAEANVLSDAGISLVVVWESTASRALAGHAAGVADAKSAVAQAQVCGMPAGRPIYFAVDFDATAGQQSAINSYLDGAASVLGRARVGLYAGYYVVKRAFDAHKITWGWQTYAWSGGHWDSRAHIQQYSNDHTLNGVGVDHDRAVKDDYGQWRVGANPEEDDVVSKEDIKAIAAAVWAAQIPIHPYYQERHQFSHPGYSAGFLTQGAVSETRTYSKAIQAQLAAQQATIDKLADALSVPGADIEDLKTEIRAGIREAIEGLDIELKVDAPDAEPADGG